jgi:hypothetical protein
LAESGDDVRATDVADVDDMLHHPRPGVAQPLDVRARGSEMTPILTITSSPDHPADDNH